MSGANNLLKQFKNSNFLSELSATKRRALIVQTKRFISYGTTKNNAEITSTTANVVRNIINTTNPKTAKNNEDVAAESKIKIENSSLPDWQKNKLKQQQNG